MDNGDLYCIKKDKILYLPSFIYSNDIKHDAVATEII